MTINVATTIVLPIQLYVCSIINGGTNIIIRGANTTLSRQDKYHILTSEPSCDASAYPRTHTSKSKSLRQFQPSWLKSFPWPDYSHHADGAFFCVCAILLSEGQAVGGKSPGKFVTGALRSCQKQISWQIKRSGATISHPWQKWLSLLLTTNSPLQLSTCKCMWKPKGE